MSLFNCNSLVSKCSEKWKNQANRFYLKDFGKRIEEETQFRISSTCTFGSALVLTLTLTHKIANKSENNSSSNRNFRNSPLNSFDFSLIISFARRSFLRVPILFFCLSCWENIYRKLFMERNAIHCWIPSSCFRWISCAHKSIIW